MGLHPVSSGLPLQTLKPRLGSLFLNRAGKKDSQLVSEII